MTEHLTQEDIEQIGLRTLSATDRSRVDAHLAACDACLKRVAKPDYVFAALSEALLPSSDETPFHLSHDELKRFARNSVDEADRVVYESHIEDCSECRLKANELAVESAPTSAAGASVKPSSWWNRLPMFGSPQRRLTPVHVVTLLAVLGALLAVVLLWQRQRAASNERAQILLESSAPTPEAQGLQLPNVAPSPSATAVPSNDSIIALNDNGRQIGLDKQGKLFGLDQANGTTRQTLAGVLAGKGLLKSKALEELSTPPIALMGGAGQGGSFRLIGPQGVVKIEERPTLRWEALPGATSYNVSVFDEDFNEIVRSGSQPGTEWTVSTPLPRGAVYSWQVKALKDGQEITSPVAPARRAQFKVLETGKLRELTRLRQQQPLSHVALGVAYASAGLLNEAEAEFQELLNANPDSAVVKKLLRTVQEWKK